MFKLDSFYHEQKKREELTGFLGELWDFQSCLLPCLENTWISWFSRDHSKGMHFSRLGEGWGCASLSEGGGKELASQLFRVMVILILPRFYYISMLESLELYIGTFLLFCICIKYGLTLLQLNWDCCLFFILYSLTQAIQSKMSAANNSL